MKSDRIAITLMINMGDNLPLVDTSVRVHDQHSLDVVHTLIEARCFGFIGRGRFVFAFQRNGHTAHHTLAVYEQSSQKKRLNRKFRTFAGLAMRIDSLFDLRDRLDGMTQPDRACWELISYDFNLSELDKAVAPSKSDLL